MDASLYPALRAAIDAETAGQVVQWRTVRADNALAAWLNESSAVDAWRKAAPVDLVDDAPSYTDFDTLTAGKRDSWSLFIARPRDFSRQKVRGWVTDVWGAATAGSNAEKIMQAAVEKAKRVEVYLGGTARTTGTVTALDRSYVGGVTVDDVSSAMSL